MARNFYVVLGIPPDAAPELIRSAFRRLARRYHPDRGKQADARSFREVAEAYDVLSDPGRRARYDRQFRRVRPVHHVPASRATASDPEPLIAEPLEPLHFELILSREESARGVRVPLWVPVFSICRQCGGTGRDWLFLCNDCGGQGRQVDQAEVDLKVPRGVRDRTRFDVSPDALGVRNLWLRVHVRVAGN